MHSDKPVSKVNRQWEKGKCRLPFLNHIIGLQGNKLVHEGNLLCFKVVNLINEEKLIQGCHFEIMDLGKNHQCLLTSQRQTTWPVASDQVYTTTYDFIHVRVLRKIKPVSDQSQDLITDVQEL